MSIEAGKVDELITGFVIENNDLLEAASRDNRDSYEIVMNALTFISNKFGGGAFQEVAQQIKTKAPETKAPETKAETATEQPAIPSEIVAAERSLESNNKLLKNFVYFDLDKKAASQGKWHEANFVVWRMEKDNGKITMYKNIIPELKGAYRNFNVSTQKFNDSVASGDIRVVGLLDEFVLGDVFMTKDKAEFLFITDVRMISNEIEVDADIYGINDDKLDTYIDKIPLKKFRNRLARYEPNPYIRVGDTILEESTNTLFIVKYYGTGLYYLDISQTLTPKAGTNKNKFYTISVATVVQNIMSKKWKLLRPYNWITSTILDIKERKSSLQAPQPSNASDSSTRAQPTQAVSGLGFGIGETFKAAKEVNSKTYIIRGFSDDGKVWVGAVGEDWEVEYKLSDASDNFSNGTWVKVNSTTQQDNAAAPTKKRSGLGFEVGDMFKASKEVTGKTYIITSISDDDKVWVRDVGGDWEMEVKLSKAIDNFSNGTWVKVNSTTQQNNNDTEEMNESELNQAIEALLPFEADDPDVQATISQMRDRLNKLKNN